MSFRKIRIYISASWDDRDKVMEFKNNIDDSHKGRYELTCRWWDHTGDDSITYALEDVIGVSKCDIFIFYNGEKKTSGKFIEFGMALAFRKTIKVYGKPLTTVFRKLTEYCGEELPKNLNK